MKERQMGLEAKAEKTKYRFADAMKTCMRRTPLEKKENKGNGSL